MIDSFMSGEFLFFGIWGALIGTFIFYVAIPIAIQVHRDNQRFKEREEEHGRGY